MSSDKVTEWIDANFETDEITIEEFPLLPKGKVITDKNGHKMLVYYDFLYCKVEIKVHFG